MNIDFKNITKTYGGKIIIKNIDLKVYDGDFIAIVGKSGSGKSTLLNIIGLFESFDSGNYLIDEEETPKVNSQASNKVIRNRISYLFQNFALVEKLSVKKIYKWFLNIQD